jgi:ribosomal peptide maturation radical SAM protein 1
VDVVLVSMPFAEVQRPSIGLGLLRASLADTGIESEIVYANLDFAERVGLAAYQAMQGAPTDHLLGEWCFAERLAPARDGVDDEYLNLVLDVRGQGFPAGLDARKDLMRWVRAQSAAFVNDVAESIVARRPRIVGCSSVFQQHCASLELLRRVRELSPDTVLLMGGANCEGEMGTETLRAFPWVDCVVSGEADGLFAELCRVLLEHGRAVDPGKLPDGAIARGHASHGTAPPRPVIRDLDALPTPHYDDYFDSVKVSTLSGLIRPGLLAESSRGCWWGERSHCTFCGLNGTGMTFRSKSAERVLAEIGALSRRYGVDSVQFVDNILDMSYFKTLLPKLADAGAPYRLFYETKANLKRDQVRLLADAGVRFIQPGIESLDDHVLRLIGKGNSALMNLQLLKWSAEFGVHPAWNMLCGVPGESDEWYAEMASWLPAVFHLQPPSGLSRVRFDRFSPYHTRARDFGLALEPSRAYGYVYDLPPESLMRLAYSFEDRGQRGHVHRGRHGQPGQQRLADVVRQWNDVWRTSRPALRAHDDGRVLRIDDRRPCASERGWTTDALQAEVCRVCDVAQTRDAVMKDVSARRGAEAPAIAGAIETLCARRVLLPLNGKLLNLAVWV